jgi:hypothetical protein
LVLHHGLLFPQEEVERRNKTNKDKKKLGLTASSAGLPRSKSRDRGLADLRVGGRRTVKHLVNTLLGKDHKNHIFGAKDHHARGEQEARVTARLKGIRTTKNADPDLAFT